MTCDASCSAQANSPRNFRLLVCLIACLTASAPAYSSNSVPRRQGEAAGEISRRPKALTSSNHSKCTYVRACFTRWARPESSSVERA
ncbi:hypothetical protein BZA05DRAFT_393190 [Tricharina praecox]|uniref:uncharacterized protein n=1 Tax=Tricharina praecox TaxID=43433 RepID=UPI00221FBBEC|nr:uncharacterized protein BZA05DRAFT_393190 [Tricharina praecox]KAI5854986.1 hypothetical protein BZA05DRAFT_393190 [Tricharina praecox]